MLRRPARLVLFFACCYGVLPAAVSAGDWLDVPFVRQEKDGCGAASISMVMQYWFKQQGRSPDESTDAHKIHRALYVRGARGIFASAMEQYFRRHGFRTFAFSGEIDDLQQHLLKGRPMIVALKPSPGSSVHYVVVVGLDPDRAFLLLNDPAQRKLMKQDRFGFEKQWSSTGKWTLLALPSAEQG